MRPLKLRWPRRAKLRTRVLAGVLAVTLIALAAFDIAGLTALRGYLLHQTDTQLQAALRLYRVSRFPPARWKVRAGGRPPVSGPPPGPASRPVQQRVIAGPVVLAPGILGRFYIAKVGGRGPKQVFVHGNTDLVPQLPAGLATLAKRQQGRTVSSRNGHGQLRLMAETFPGYGTVYATTSLGDVNRTLGQLEIILILGSAAAGLIAAGGVAWVMRRGLRPIEVMAGQADKINAGGLADRVNPDDPRTEIGRLGAALNGMLARIEGFLAEREASQEAARRFFADASHELRTPLASLRANAELYGQGVLAGRDQVDEAMRRIRLESRRMSGLVDDMLRLARLDQHPQQECEPVDLSALAAECVRRARTADPRRAWQSDITPGLELSGDEELLRRAIDNVLANVTAHTADGSTATLTVTERDGVIALTVADDGPGVPPDQLPRIFDRFYRATAPSRRPGSGLGLAIAAAVTAAHAGHVEAELGQPHGLRVTLILPAGRGSGPPVPSPQAGFNRAGG